MSNFANPELDNYFRRVILPSSTSVAPAIVFANDLTNGLYWTTDGLVLSGLAAPVNDGDAANKAYVDAGGGSGATTALDNLAAVAINTDLTGGAGFLGLSSDPTNGARIELDPDGSMYFSQGGVNAIIVHANHTQLELGFTEIDFGAGSNGTGAFDTDSTAGNTRLIVYDVDAGTLSRVSVGSVNSGGTGFKLLRVPN